MVPEFDRSFKSDGFRQVPLIFPTHFAATYNFHRPAFRNSKFAIRNLWAPADFDVRLIPDVYPLPSAYFLLRTAHLRPISNLLLAS